VHYTTSALDISKAVLQVKADVKVVDQGTALPPGFFTYTITGYKNSDTPARVSGPVFITSPVYTAASPAGIYGIIPSSYVFTPNTNYTVSYVSDSLYVNPKGGKTKNVKPVLDCVDTLINDPSGLQYLARFSYENPNSATVYVPIGPNNNISGQATYTGTPPVIFRPGAGKFTIPFDGRKITWLLITYNGNQKTSSSSIASSTSNKCQRARPVAPSIVELPAEQRLNIYPNPVKDKLTIYLQGTGKAVISVAGVTGKIYKLKETAQTEENSKTVDMSALSSGVYFITVWDGKNKKTFRVIKI
jgi:hypothetical protein